MSNAAYDPVSGIITLKASGLQSEDQIEERAQIVRELIQTAKRDRGHAHILNFAQDLPVQTSLVARAGQTAGLNDALDGPRDKLAIVISSALTRIQLQRIIGSPKRRVFGAEDEARAWLAAE